jgi:hypothetical protein
MTSTFLLIYSSFFKTCCKWDVTVFVVVVRAWLENVNSSLLKWNGLMRVARPSQKVVEEL